MNELDLFAAAVAIGDTTQRNALLDRECADNPELRARLDQLLEAHFRSQAPLDKPPSIHTGPYTPNDNDGERPAPEVAGAVIAGRYKLLQQIGEGGMGTVWMADQTEPVKRPVAVKLIRAERGQSKAILARFEAERQAIALMDHPHIAKLLDAGTTQAGNPFFVMELVKGVPLTDYCDTHRLGIPERLQLFMQICSAVQHAHQKGIIHRDLKPSNILVEAHDGKPVPKVIDFGLAKATTGLQLTDQSLFTAFGSVMGTPLYMAPEQASFNALDVDTRADVYALGVVLYELLTGTTPLTREALRKAAVDEMYRLIREQEAPTPSSRLSGSDNAPSVAANRQTEPAKLGRLVRGELDWIVLKALSKERDRRYETANGFARDVERFLNHEPVSAGPPTARYRLKKFVRRNRAQVLGAGLVFAALVVGMVGTTIGLLEARRQAEIAQGEADKKEAARADEARQRGVAETNLGYARKGNAILGSVFEGLEPKKIAESGRPLQEVLRENLVKAVKELDGSAIGDPLEVAAMQDTLGVSLLGLGDYELAFTVLGKARETRTTSLGPNHPDTLDSMNHVAWGYQLSGQFEKALLLLKEMLERVTASLGPDHPDTLLSMNNLAATYDDAGQLDKALSLYKEVLERRTARLGPDHPQTLHSMHNLANGYKSSGQSDKALPLFKETLERRTARLGPDHPDTLYSLNGLAHAYLAAGQLDKALLLFKETLERRTASLGPDHPSTLDSMDGFAKGYRAVGQWDKALPLQKETLERRTARLGPDHPNTINSMRNLAVDYQLAGQLEKALPLYKEAFERSKAKLGPDHPNTLANMGSLALGYQYSRQLDKALPLYKETLDRMTAKLGPDHPNTLMSMGYLAGGYHAAGQLDKALPLFIATVERMTTRLGPDHPQTLTIMNNLAGAYHDARQLDKALPLRKEALERHTAKLGIDHPDTFICMNNLAFAHHAAGQLDKALPLYKEAFERMTAKLGPDHPQTLNSMNNLAGAYKAAGEPDKVLVLHKETLERMTAKLGPDHPTTLNSMHTLALTYQAAGQLDKALPLYKETLDRMTAKVGPDHPSTLRCMNGLAVAYYGAGQLDKALPLFEEKLERTKVRLGPEHPDTLIDTNNLGKAYCKARQGEKAATTLTAFVAAYRKRTPQGTPAFAEILAQVALDLLGCDQFRTAEGMLRECLAIREETQPDVWTTFNTMSTLGGALLGQKQYADAEPLLVKGYEGMKQREKAIPLQGLVRLPEALDRLIGLYTATNKPEEVRKWQAERNKNRERLPPPHATK